MRPAPKVTIDFGNGHTLERTLKGNTIFYVMRADGTGNQPVTRSELWDSAPDWGPAGS